MADSELELVFNLFAAFGDRFVHMWLSGRCDSRLLNFELRLSPSYAFYRGFASSPHRLAASNATGHRFCCSHSTSAALDGVKFLKLVADSKR